jgi:hypothetical protein
MTAVPFFYDEQIKRYLIQFIRLMSNFQVQFGKDTEGNVTLQRVPARYGDSSRQAANILRNNSENTLNTVPMISCYISGLAYDRERVQNPYFVSNMHIRERAYDEHTGEYQTTQGNAFTIERLMPAPYKLTIKADIWTSNTEQKLQIIEQLGWLFNPSIEVQSTDNYVDWTSLSVVTLTDTSWSSRSIPVGTDDPIDIFTYTFEMPIWISAPVKIKKLGVIQKIIGGIYDAHGNLNLDNIDQWTLLGNRSYYTPMNYGVILNGNQLTLLKYQDTTNPNLSKNGTRDNWRALINVYGKLTEGISQIRLLQSDEETEVIGTVAFHPTDDSVLLFTVNQDTIPVDTEAAVNAIINPLTKGPGAGLPAATTGQRYILTQSIGDAANIDGADAWKGTGSQDLVANANDIIQYNGTQWVVSLDSRETLEIKYVTNIATNQQYKWTGSHWIRSYEGEYKNGRWSIVL